MGFLDFGGFSELDSLIANSMSKNAETNEWECITCGRAHKDKARVRRHVETHFQGFQQKCPQCGKMVNSRNALRNHMSEQHSKRKIPGGSSDDFAPHEFLEMTEPSQLDHLQMTAQFFNK